MSEIKGLPDLITSGGDKIYGRYEHVCARCLHLPTSHNQDGCQAHGCGCPETPDEKDSEE